MSAKVWKTRRQGRRGSGCKHEPKWDKRLQDFRSSLSEFWESCVPVLCNYGNCQQDTCPECRKIVGGVGPLGCPCDLTRGWHRKRVEQMGEPAAPVKLKRDHRRAGVERRRREAVELKRRYGRFVA